MFTGIVRERGRVVSARDVEGGRELEIEAPETAGEASVGDSIDIDGCCLTASAVANGHLSFVAIPETLSRTTIGALGEGDEVNVEPALRAGDPLGGHYVQGHVDATGRVREIDTADGHTVWIDPPAAILRYCVEKGSITVDGVSLTIAALDENGFAVALVPHTLEATTLGSLAPGDDVNVEVDVLAKYVERLRAT